MVHKKFNLITLLSGILLIGSKFDFQKKKPFYEGKKIFIVFNMNNFNILHRKTLKKCTLNTGLKCGHYTVLSGSFFKIQKDNMQNNECISCGIFFSVSLILWIHWLKNMCSKCSTCWLWLNLFELFDAGIKKRKIKIIHPHWRRRRWWLINKWREILMRVKRREKKKNDGFVAYQTD